MKAPRMGAGAVKAAPAMTDWFGHGDYPNRRGWYWLKVPRSSTVKPRAGKNIWFSGFDWYMSDNGCGGPLRLQPGDKWRGLAADPAKAGK